jgi:hypothetical protein
VKASLALVAVILVVGGIVTAIGGTSAGLVVGLASGSATFGTVMSTRAAVVITVVLGAAAAVGAAASGLPWLSGLAVGVTALAIAPANAYSAGMLMLAPLITLVFTVTDRGFTWWQAGVWGVVGGLVGLAVARFLRYGKQPPRPVPWPIAWRHAVVLALAAGVSVAVAEIAGEPHAYWVTVTLLVALRPIPDERSALALPRIAGTLLGALLAVLLVLILPSTLLLIAAIGCLLALAAYAMSANYFMQTVFLTPMLLLFMTYGDPPEATIELTVGRVFYTLLGATLVALLAWGMTRWDQRSAIPADPAQTPAPD